MHGYDITDHNRINPEVGSEEELQQLLSLLKHNGMSLLLDVVPNHMGVGYGTQISGGRMCSKMDALRNMRTFSISTGIR